MRVAGALGELFDSGAKREVYRLTDGVPRLINVICDRALLGAYSREIRGVNRRLVRRAAAEIKGEPYSSPLLRWAMPAITATVVVVIGASIWSLTERRDAIVDAAAEPVAMRPASALPPLETSDTPTAEPAAAEPEPVEPETPELDEQLVMASGLTGVDSAFAVLFDLWGLEYSGAAGDGCALARSSGYACLVQRGSWSSLRQLDRPAILVLTDSQGETHRVVLTALRGDRAELSIAGVNVTHPVVQVTDLWFGQFVLLWKPPNGTSLDMGPGSLDPNVVWLRQSLASIDERYRAEPLDSDLYDTALEQRVRDFQRDHRLDVDGLAGRQTQIIINSLLAPDDTPRLTTPRLARD